MHSLNMCQCVFEKSWIKEAYRIQKILQHDLSHYKSRIDDASYKMFESKMKNTKKQTWYSNKMPADALVYILSTEDECNRRKLHAVKDGSPWSEIKTKAELAEAMSKATADWKVKVPKLVSVLNPEYGDFLQSCEKMHHFCEIEKATNNKQLTVHLDRARLFTAVSLDPQLRCQLLEAQCQPDRREAFFHPTGFTDNDTKTWCHTWGMWSTIDGLAISFLKAMLIELMPTVPPTKLKGQTPESLALEIVEDLKFYSEKVKKTYFSSIWISKKEDRHDLVIYRRRAKRLVYRFFLDREVQSAEYWWSYPGCFREWTKLEGALDGAKIYSDFSMYPTETEPPAGRELTDWERMHCPWYIDSDRWSTRFGSSERNLFLNIAKGGTNPWHLKKEKLQPEGIEHKAAARMEAAAKVDVVLVDRRRAKKTDSRKGDSAKGSKSQRAYRHLFLNIANGGSNSCHLKKKKLQPEAIEHKATGRMRGEMDAAARVDVHVDRSRKSRAKQTESREWDSEKSSESQQTAREKRRQSTTSVGQPIDLAKQGNVKVYPRDVENTQKPKRKKVAALSDDDESDEEIGYGLGIERKATAFTSGESRHIFMQSGVASSRNSVNEKKKPAWFKPCDAWAKSLTQTGLRPMNAKINGIEKEGLVAHLGIVFFPTNYRPDVHSTTAPKWNIWDDTLPDMFFGIMAKLLADDGFLAVINGGDFIHPRKIHDAAGRLGFKSVRRIPVMLKKPLFENDSDLQVYLLYMDVFCRTAYSGRIPKDPGYLPIQGNDGSSRNILKLYYPSSDPYPETSFAGPMRLSVSFMQTIIELLTKPKEIVLDWTIATGATFLAGDLSGRFVIGLEDRESFPISAQKVFNEVHSRNTPRQEETSPKGFKGLDNVLKDIGIDWDNLVSDTEEDDLQGGGA